MNNTVEIKPRPNWPPGGRATIGFIFPWAFSGHIYEYSLFLPEGVATVEAPLDLKELTVDALKAIGKEAIEMSKRLSSADVIGFACTAASFIGGVEHDKEIIVGIEKATGKPATTTATAVAEGLEALGAKKIILVSPYPEDITDIEMKYFADQGFETVYHESLGLPGRKIDVLPLAETYKFAMQVYSHAPEADAMFLTCGGLPSAEIIDPLQKAIGMPVISSKTCLMRQCLKLAKIHEPIQGYGKLLEMER
ncbi:Arylmalonate decarboxylase [subsurface metagenome]